MYVNRQVVAIAVNTSGAQTAYSPVMNGRLSDIQFINTDLATTVDFTITMESTGQSVLSLTNVSASFIKAPRQAVHDVDGTGVTFDGTNEIYDHICVDNERFEIVVAGGGSGKTGNIHITLV